MIPITRKELYLNKIVGNDDYSVPEKPISEEEFFFAEILGEAVQAPEPLTRYQMYLAKIAGRNIEIPTPITRLELFLAKACGMDIETPTPITREEIFWSNYSAIVDFEVEGVPPLTYKAIEGTLENYRIYGNTVGGAGVGDLVESGEHAGEYKVPVTVSNGTDTLTTPIYLPEPIKMVGNEPEYIDYAEQKQHRVRKNLLQNTATSQTINGVTFTVNEDGSVTCNGTATTLIVFKVNAILTLPVGEFILTGSPTGGSWHSSYYLYAQTDNISPQKFYNDIGNGVTINNTSADIVYSTRIVIERDYSINNRTFYPMIRLASIEDDTYEPYIENTDLDVTLPALPTLPGTNVLSVGTAVQPSKVYVKYKGEHQ